MRLYDCCLVLQLRLPADRDKLIARLKARGKAHFDGQTSDTVLTKAAECLVDDREQAKRQHWRPLPGQAEYLDLLRAVIRQRQGNPAAQEALIDQVKRFVLRKPLEADQIEEDDTESDR